MSERLADFAPDLLKIATWAIEYIDAIPKEIEFPAMMGFDRDWADGVIARAAKAKP